MPRRHSDFTFHTSTRRAEYSAVSPEIIAVGKSSINVKYHYSELLDFFSYTLDSYPLINVLKDRLGYAEMKVYILRKTDNEPKAIVMVNLVKNVTVEGIGGGTWENSTIETGWMWLEEFTPEGGYFCSVTTGMRDIAPNIDGWLSNLIEDIEMVKTD